jgi:hypothetical protein
LLAESMQEANYSVKLASHGEHGSSWVIESPPSWGANTMAQCSDEVVRMARSNDENRLDELLNRYAFVPRRTLNQLPVDCAVIVDVIGDVRERLTRDFGQDGIGRDLELFESLLLGLRDGPAVDAQIQGIKDRIMRLLTDPDSEQIVSTLPVHRRFAVPHLPSLLAERTKRA